MFLLTLKAYAMLIRLELCMARGGFGAVYELVRTTSVAKMDPFPGNVHRVCRAVDLACIWSWKQILCFERSAVTVCLLRNSGVPAEMVIGAQNAPFRAHAWVEVAGQVVNDKPYIPDVYAALDRC
jgi:Transglutaminase-like superfamily